MARLRWVKASNSPSSETEDMGEEDVLRAPGFVAACAALRGVEGGPRARRDDARFVVFRVDAAAFRVGLLGDVERSRVEEAFLFRDALFFEGAVRVKRTGCDGGGAGECVVDSADVGTVRWIVGAVVFCGATMDVSREREALLKLVPAGEEGRVSWQVVAVQYAARAVRSAAKELCSGDESMWLEEPVLRRLECFLDEYTM